MSTEGQAIKTLLSVLTKPTDEVSKAITALRQERSDIINSLSQELHSNPDSLEILSKIEVSYQRIETLLSTTGTNISLLKKAEEKNDAVLEGSPNHFRSKEVLDQEIFNGVKEVLKDGLGLDDDEVTPEATFIGDLGGESLDFLDIAFRLEKEFEMKIPRNELFEANASGIVTVSTIVEYIMGRKKQQVQ